MNTATTTFQEGDLVKLISYGSMGTIKSIAGAFVYVNLPEGLIIPVSKQEVVIVTASNVASSFGSIDAA